MTNRKSLIERSMNDAMDQLAAIEHNPKYRSMRRISEQGYWRIWSLIHPIRLAIVDHSFWHERRSHAAR